MSAAQALTPSTTNAPSIPPSDAPSEGTQLTRITALLKSLSPNFNIWDYSAGVGKILKATSSDATWKRASKLLYCHQRRIGSGVVEVDLCAIQGALSSAKLEAAHVQASIKGRGQVLLDRLIECNVVPKCCFHLCPANIIHLGHDVHRALDSLSIDFAPTLEPVLARLTCEIIYQEQRRQYHNQDDTPSSSRRKLPIRPSFDLFYRRLEKPLAVIEVSRCETFPWELLWRVEVEPRREPRTFAFPKDRLEEEQLEGAGYPPLPLFLAPISTNLLINATARRIRKLAPVSLARRNASAVVASAVELLIEYWSLTEGQEAEVEDLLRRSAVFLREEGPAFHSTVVGARTSLSTFSFKTFPLPSVPTGAVTSSGNFSDATFYFDVDMDESTSTFDFDPDISFSTVGTEDGSRTPTDSGGFDDWITETVRVGGEGEGGEAQNLKDGWAGAAADFGRIGGGELGIESDGADAS